MGFLLALVLKMRVFFCMCVSFFLVPVLPFYLLFCVVFLALKGFLVVIVYLI